MIAKVVRAACRRGAPGRRRGRRRRAAPLAEQCRDTRRQEFVGFHQRVGLDAERWYLQQTRQGELFALYPEGDPAGAIGKLAASDHPFDVWFREQAKQIHGIDFSQPLPAPPPEVIFEG